MAGGAERAQLDDWMRQGYALHEGGDLERAAGFYRRILEADPGYVDATFLLGMIAEAQGAAEEAAARFQAAAAARPDEPAFLFALGKQQYRARRFEEAVDTLERGLALRPDDPDARHDYGSSLMELSRWDEALAVVEPLARGAEDSFATQYNLANLYRQLGRVQDAIGQYRKALALSPGHLDTQGCLLFMLNYSDRHSAADIFAEHRAFGERLAQAALPPVAETRWPRRLRIGYLSPDFRHHAVACFIAPVLERHDRGRFEVRCYYTRAPADEVTARLRGHAEHWSDCAGLTDEAIAQRIRDDRIDILVDLAGHTSGGRVGVLAMKPAPLQVSYLGYPNTTGLASVDYRIGDAITDPAGSADALNVERLLRLPRTFLAYRPLAPAPDPGPLPLLRNGHVTFGCYNNFFKQSGTFLDTAAKLLLAIPGARLTLKGGPLYSASVADGVRARFAAAGVAPDRLVLLGWTTTYDDHLAAYRDIDIALDSFPYAGTTTTCEALSMGVPVVTLQGDRHAARVGASLLSALGLNEWVARSTDEFVSTCVRLAADVEGLKAHRAGLRERMRASPLMDEHALTLALEDAYLKMWTDRLSLAACK